MSFLSRERWFWDARGYSFCKCEWSKGLFRVDFPDRKKKGWVWCRWCPPPLAICTSSLIFEAESKKWFSVRLNVPCFSLGLVFLFFEHKKYSWLRLKACSWTADSTNKGIVHFHFGILIPLKHVRSNWLPSLIYEKNKCTAQYYLISRGRCSFTLKAGALGMSLTKLCFFSERFIQCHVVMGWVSLFCFQVEFGSTFWSRSLF